MEIRRYKLKLLWQLNKLQPSMLWLVRKLIERLLRQHSYKMQQLLQPLLL
jgi:hypothetical protein